MLYEIFRELLTTPAQIVAGFFLSRLSTSCPGEGVEDKSICTSVQFDIQKNTGKIWIFQKYFLSLYKPKTEDMDYKVITSSSPEQLSNRVKEYINEGWKPVGGHSVVETHRQNRFSGQQHMDTLIKVEYSQTIIKE